MCLNHAVDRRKVLTRSLALAAFLATGCRSEGTGKSAAQRKATTPSTQRSSAPSTTMQPSTTATAPPQTATPADMAARAMIPVLCWHQLREWRSDDSTYSRRFLVCPPANFRAQLDTLVDDGWTSISPAMYLEHLTTGAALPAKPVMLSFDDSQGDQVTEGLPQLLQRNMTATFFCMTVVLDKPGWMSSDDLRRLADDGMTVAAHTYDHNRADRYSGEDWNLQLAEPREYLEKVIGRPVEHFAYPYGAWSPVAFEHLEAAGYKTAFQLSDQQLDQTAPEYTLRRILVDSNWAATEVLQQIRQLA